MKRAVLNATIFPALNKKNNANLRSELEGCLFMAIILYCQNGHNLSTRDPIRMGRITPQRAVAIAEQFRRDKLAPRQPFCNECGAPTLDKCQHCKSEIVRGHRPAYCGACGKPFPWTETALAAAKEYTDELEELSAEDRASLKSTLDDLTADTPRTELAIHRLKKFMQKIGPAAGDALTKIMVNVATEAAKKGMGM